MHNNEIKHIAIILLVGAAFFSSTLFIDYPFLKSNHQTKFYIYKNYYIPKTENKLIVGSYKPKRPYLAPKDSSMQSTIKVSLAKARVSAGSTPEIEESQNNIIPNGIERRNENTPSGMNGGVLAMGKRSASESAINNGVSGSGSSVSMGTSLFSSSNSTSQSGPYTPNQGGTDPGGDPLKPRIPVGNELGVLLSLVAAYAAFKKFKRK
jgi:hypothetical protein